jgi:hypothetical protein
MPKAGLKCSRISWCIILPPLPWPNSILSILFLLSFEKPIPHSVSPLKGGEVYKNFLPFKGRIKVGMGYWQYSDKEN